MDQSGRLAALRRRGIYVLLLVTAAAVRAESFVAPGGAWEARIPRPDCPTTCNTRLGYWAERGAAEQALAEYAATHGPEGDPRRYATALARVPFTLTERDLDGDGSEDRIAYTHAFQDAFPARLGCADFAVGARAPGWSAIFNGSPVTLAEEQPAAILPALEALVYTRGTVSCSLPRGLPRHRRVHLPVFTLRRQNLVYACPRDYGLVDLVARGRGCEAAPGALVAERNLGPQCPLLRGHDNPVNAVSGNKYHRELDHPPTARGSLGFERHYNSQSDGSGALGARWRHGYERDLSVACVGGGSARRCSVRATRPDGRVVTFNVVGSAWRSVAAAAETLEGPETGPWLLIAADGTREHYAASTLIGNDTRRFPLAALEQATSGRETLHYDGRGRLVTVRDVAGRSLTFAHDDAGRLVSLTDPSGHRYTYHYDQRGLLVAVVLPGADGGEARRRYHYAEGITPGLLSAVDDGSGVNRGRWTYDERGRVRTAGGDGQPTFVVDYEAGYTTLTDEDGRVHGINTTIVDGIGLVSAVSGPSCAHCGAGEPGATVYDARGYRQRVTDARGNVTTYGHDETGLETSRTEALGSPVERSVTTTWDRRWRLPLVSTLLEQGGRPLRRTAFSYHDGRLTARTEVDLTGTVAASRGTRYEYFGDDGEAVPAAVQGRLRQVDGPRTDVADVTSYGYDAATGDLTTITDALGHVHRFGAHDAHGRVLQVTDPNAVDTRLTYGPRGHLLAQVRAGLETRYRRDAEGRLVAVEHADGSRTTLRHDGAGRVVAIADGAGREQVLERDAQGRVVAERWLDADGSERRTRTYGWDERGDLVRWRDGADGEFILVHDRNGNRLTQSLARADGVVEQVSLVYDALDRVQEVVPMHGGSIRLLRGAADELRQVTDPRGSSTLLTYDGLGDLVHVYSMDSGDTHHVRDAAGRRSSTRDARGVQVDHHHDALGRLLAIDYPDQPDVSFEYDGPATAHAVGRLARRSDESGVTDFRYDAAGRVVEQAWRVDGTTYVLRLQRDALGRVLRLDYPSGRRVDYLRDGQGGVTAIRTAAPGQDASIVLDELGREPFGPPRGWRFGNGRSVRFVHDRAYHVSAVLHEGLPAWHLRRDAAGRVTTIERGADRGDDLHYTYDGRGRLVTATGPWGNWRFEYDRNDNLTRLWEGTVPMEIRHVRYNSQIAHLYPAGRDGPVVSFRYDAAGYPLGEHPGNRYAFGADGRLGRLELPDGSVVDMRHDADGRVTEERLQESGGEAGPRVTARRTLRDVDGRPLEILTTRPDGRVEHVEYIYLDDLPVARIVDGVVGYLHGDHLGTPIAVSDAQGVHGPVSVMPPFLRGRDRLPQALPELGYPGQLRVLGSAELYHNGWREYDARWARYLAADPLGMEGGLNPYAYAVDDPVNRTDPSGLAVWICARDVNGFPWAGNHAYYADDRNGATCGKQGSFGFGGQSHAERGLQGDDCREIPGSEGREDDIMDCCDRWANHGPWLPWINDCHSLIDDCLRSNGLFNPGAPGGRFDAGCVLGCDLARRMMSQPTP